MELNPIKAYMDSLLIENKKYNFNNIEWKPSTDGPKELNPIVYIKGKMYRPRVETLVFNKEGKVLCINNTPPTKFGTTYYLPGGGFSKEREPIKQAYKECQEEARINITNIKDTGLVQIADFHGNYPDWHKKKLWPMGIKYEGSVTLIFVADYKSPYKGYIREIDKDDFYKSAKFVDPDEVKWIPEHKQAVEFYRKSLHENAEVLDEGMFDMTLYHGSPYKFDVLKPTGVNIGNKIEKPKWSLFLWRSKDIAISWAMFSIIKKNIFRLGGHIYNLDENGNKEYFIFISTNKDFHMVLREDMYDKIKKISIGLKCYVYTVSTKFYKVGLGNEISKPEFTVDEEIVPDKVEEITITKNMFDKYVIKVDRKTCNYLFSIMNKNNARSIFKYLYHDNDEIMEKYSYIYRKIKTGEIKPGDDLEGILNKKFPKNIQESAVEFIPMNNIEIVEEENNTTDLEKAKSIGIDTSFLENEFYQESATKESIIIDTLNDFKNKKIKDDFRPNKEMPLRDIDQIYKDGKANCVDIAYCLHDICKRNNIDHTIGNVKWEFNKNKSHGHVFIVINNNNNYTSYHYFGDTRTIKIIQKGNSYLECVKLTGEQLKQEASFIPDNVTQKEYIYSAKDLNKVDHRNQLASNQKDFIDLLQIKNLKESANDPNNYQAALEVWKQLSHEEQLLVSPRGRYVDSPNLITRSIYRAPNGKSVAFMDAYKNNGSDKNAFVIIAILPAYRGKGIGQKLINSINSALKKGKYQNMIWRVDKSNIASAKLAQKLGFTFYKQTKNSITYIKKI